MSCELSSGILQGCKDVMGGIKYFWLANFDDVTATTITAGVVDSITMAGSTQFWKYEVRRNTSDFTSPGKTSVENGTVVYEHTLNLVFNKNEATKNLQIQLLAAARLSAVGIDFNGKAWFFGRENGLDCTAVTMESGKKGEDLNGYKITLTGAEPALPYEFDPTLIVSPNFV